MFQLTPITTAKTLGLAFLAALSMVLLGGGAVAGQASAAPVKVVKLTAPSKLIKGERYRVYGQVLNGTKKRVKGKVRVSLSTKRRPGRIELAKKKLVVKKKSKAKFKVAIKVGPSVAAGRYFLLACFKSSCKSKRVRVVEPDDIPTYEPGATTAGDVLFPGIGNGGYDALSYDIELDYHPLANTFAPGTHTTMTAEATQNLSSFSLDFMPATMNIGSVTVDGYEVPYSLEDLVISPTTTYPDAKLIVDLKPDNLMDDGDEFEVDVAYSGYVTHVTDPDTSREGWVRACRSGLPGPSNPDCYGSFTVSEPIGAMSWFPSNNVPADKATFETSTTVPTEALPANEWTALGTGEFVSKEVDGADTTWTWEEEQPTSTYLTTGSVGRYNYSVASAEETSTGRTIPLYNAYDLTATPTQVTNMTTAFAAQEGLINMFAPLFGPYPFSSGGLLGARTTGVGYFLENQGKIHAPSPSIPLPVLAHEYVHQWFGDAVGPAQWSQIWFNEGWAQWGEWYYISPTEPATQFADIYANAPLEDWDIPPGTLDGDAANLFAEFPTYIRAGMMLEGYRQIVGDTKFFEFAKQLQIRFAYSTVDAADVTDLGLEMSEFTGDDRALLADYFDQWLFLSGKPTIVPASFPAGP